MNRFLTASYEKLIEDLYASDRPKLEAALESDAKEVLSDPSMRKLLREFIVRLDKGSHFEPSSLKAVRYFELLETINTQEKFNQEKENIKCLCPNEDDLSKVVDESTFNRFLVVQQRKTFRKVDESYEYRKFKEYLKTKYQSRRRRHR